MNIGKAALAAVLLGIGLMASVASASIGIPPGVPKSEAEKGSRTGGGDKSTQHPGYFLFNATSPSDTSSHYYWKFDNESTERDGNGGNFANGNASRGRVKIPEGATSIHFVILYDGTVGGETVWTFGIEDTKTL